MTEIRPPSMEAKMRSSASTSSMRCWERMRILDGWVELDFGAESCETSFSRRSVVLV